MAGPMTDMWTWNVGRYGSRVYPVELPIGGEIDRDRPSSPCMGTHAWLPHMEGGQPGQRLPPFTSSAARRVAVPDCGQQLDDSVPTAARRFDERSRRPQPAAQQATAPSRDQQLSGQSRPTAASSSAGSRARPRPVA
ncbi:hypothetical protein Dimus_030310 [Dionaea muscipula]